MKKKHDFMYGRDAELEIYKINLRKAGVPSEVLKPMKLGRELDWLIWGVLIAHPPYPWQWIVAALNEAKFKHGAKVFEQENALDILLDPPPTQSES